ncbi:MAG TPA: pilin [Steroidobacteraceae bacterium]|nr:pilin [Steroidobacteraceae bacterium]
MNDPLTITDEQRYRAAVGPKGDFYVPKFLRFDAGGSKQSWNWPAFFLGVVWMLYRRMWSTAVYLFLISIGLGLIEALIVEPGVGKQMADVIGYGINLACMLVVGVIANALYHRRIKLRITSVAQSGLDDFQVFRALERGPHTSMVGVIIGALFLILVVAGILAAIAIPAYQDYTIRAQVTEGLLLASPAKAAVAESFNRDGHWPADLQEARMTSAPAGKYVSALAIDHGTIQITYGNAANALIAGKTLSIRPTVSAKWDVVWSCGYAEGDGREPGTGEAAANATSIAMKYLPISCRQ